MALDVFQETWCARCLNQDCTRSIAGKSRFEARINSWEERLFLNPLRMAPDDPRFPKIAAQRFMMINPGRTPEVSGWTDPLDPVQPEPQMVAEQPIPETHLPLLGTPRQLEPPARAQTALQNAPDQSGTVLLAPPSSIRLDPWAAPEPLAPGEVLISSGSTVKLRGSGV